MMKNSGSRSFFWIILIALFSFFLTFFFYVSHQVKEVKGPLIAFLKNQIHGEIQIEEAKASFLPLGIRLKGVKLFAPEEKEAAAFIEEVDLRFKLFPLLHRDIDTKIYIQEPRIQMVLGIDGKNNFEKIFEPLLLGQNAKSSGLAEDLWWKHLVVSQLVIEDARFTSSDARNATPVEVQNLDVEASDIRLESSKEPARIKITFDLPRFSKKSVKIQFMLQSDSKQEELKFEEGKIKWGVAEMLLGGKVLLPNSQRKSVELNLNFSLDNMELKDFSKMLAKPLALTGDISWKGTLQGSAFGPILNLKIDSRKLVTNGMEITRLHTEISKQDKVVEITKAQMEVFEGLVNGTGTLLPEKTISGNFLLNLQGLSLAAITGKPSPAHLSGKLEVKGSNVEDPRSFSGEGDVNVGPIPLPVTNLSDKLKIAELISNAALQDKAMNLGFLSSSANVIGTQIDNVNAHVTFSGDDITLNPYRLSNSHFSATGSGTIKNRKSIHASGTATLSSAVTTLLIPNPNFRSALTGGKSSLSVPYSVTGTLDNPNFAVDAAYFKDLIAKAAAATLKDMIMGDKKPSDFLNSALQGSALGNVPIPSINKKQNSKPKNFEQFLFGK